MNLKLLKTRDVEIIYELITGTDVKDELSREEMLEHLFWVHSRKPKELQAVIYKAFKGEEAEELADLRGMSTEYILPRYSTGGLLIADSTRSGQLVPAQPSWPNESRVTKRKSVPPSTNVYSKGKKKTIPKDTVYEQVLEHGWRVRYTDSSVIWVRNQYDQSFPENVWTPEVMQFLYKKGLRTPPTRELVDYGEDWAIIRTPTKLIVRILAGGEVEEYDAYNEAKARELVEDKQEPYYWNESDLVTLDTGMS